MPPKLVTMEELGWSREDMLSLAVQVARYAAYQLAGDERKRDWREIAAHESTDAAIGPERWLRLARFTLDAMNDMKILGETDDTGPVVREQELARLGGLVLLQFVSQEQA